MEQERIRNKSRKRKMKRAGTSGFVILNITHAVREYCVFRKT